MEERKKKQKERWHAEVGTDKMMERLGQEEERSRRKDCRMKVEGTEGKMAGGRKKEQKERFQEEAGGSRTR
jgi:hypothetical protein